ncbi:MAG: TlpA family protein disulfide reductase [Bacteroidales bacterium]|nr:TlpA family protein disulfide reductase [Bacteroidales bacterium]
MEKSSKTVQITGNILHRDLYPNTKELRLKIPDMTGNWGRDMSFIVSPIQEDSTFYFTFELAQPQDVILETYIDFLYLRPGDSLHITLDFKGLTTVQLSGGDIVDLNRDFYRYFDETFYRSVIQNVYHISTDCMNNCSNEEIIRLLNEKRDNFRTKRDDFLQKYQVGEEVRFITEARMELDYYRALIDVMLSRKSLNLDHITPEVLLEELNSKAVKYFSAGLYSTSHFRFISDGYFQVVNRIKPFDSIASFGEWAKEMAYNDTIKNMMVVTQASVALAEINLETFEVLYAQMDSGYNYLRDRLMLVYQKTVEKLNHPEVESGGIIGNPKDFQTLIANDPNNLIAEIASKHSDKVTVINMYAPWCAPCHKVLDQYPAFANDYMGKDVDFVFIGCGIGKKCQVMLSERGLAKYPHYQITDEQMKVMVKSFGLMGMPFGVLINKKGIIIDSGSHLRPSPELRNKVNRLLEHDKLL